MAGRTCAGPTAFRYDTRDRIFDRCLHDRFAYRGLNSALFSRMIDENEGWHDKLLMSAIDHSECLGAANERD
jgi:hypothetical protein